MATGQERGPDATFLPLPGRRTSARDRLCPSTAVVPANGRARLTGIDREVLELPHPDTVMVLSEAVPSVWPTQRSPAAAYAVKPPEAPCRICATSPPAGCSPWSSA